MDRRFWTFSKPSCFQCLSPSERVGRKNRFLYILRWKSYPTFSGKKSENTTGLHLLRTGTGSTNGPLVRILSFFTLQKNVMNARSIEKYILKRLGDRPAQGRMLPFQGRDRSDLFCKNMPRASNNRSLFSKESSSLSVEYSWWLNTLYIALILAKNLHNPNIHPPPE